MLRRRDLVVGAGAAAAALAAGCRPSRATGSAAPSLERWEGVRAQFRLTPDKVHLSSLFISTHPRPVREAIERHRAALDQDPVDYLVATNIPALLEVYAEAARFFGAAEDDVALTRSTTEGLALLYNGLKLEPGDRILTEEGGYYSTWRAVDFKARRSGALRQTVSLFDDPAQLGTDAVVERLMDAVDERTRAVALTWVHSDTGVKLPLRAIADALAERSARVGRPILLCVDGVHGFGVEDTSLATLGCDFFASGCHKWLYGPRGTGVLYAAGRPQWDELIPTIPAFGLRKTPGQVMTPGGFHSFEHRWALADAFRFHQEVGQPRITARIRALAAQLKEGLAGIAGVRLLTPRDPERSAGIVSFELEGLGSPAVVSRLGDQGFVLTQAPHGREAVRAAPGYINSPEEIDRLLKAVRALV